MQNALEGLQKSLAGLDRQKAAPVDKWNPPYCGELDMRIGRDGLWYYLGTPIGRKPLVKLFASVLRQDDDGVTYLVTPLEKIAIKVEDGHYLGVEMQAEGDGAEQIISIRTQTDDWVTIGPENALTFRQDKMGKGEDGNIVPYVHMRGRLECRINRAVFYELIELGEHKEIDGHAWFGVWSAGQFYKMIETDKLEQLSEL